MKKSFSIMAFALVAALGLTACHDDDDDDENSATVANYDGSGIIGASIFNNLTGKVGLTSCYFTDESSIADFYTFSTSSVDDIAAMGELSADGKTVTLDKEGLAIYGEGTDELDPSYAGGFCPTWFNASDNTPFAPASGSFRTGRKGALICNPGMFLRAFFTRHMAVDLSSAMAAIKKLKVNSLYVCPVDAYKYIGKTDDDTPYDYEGYASDALPANHQIEFVVYGYVDNCTVSNVQSAISALKDAGKNAAKGGTLCATPVVLAETDEAGTLTINSDWQKMDLTSLKDYYLLEASIRVIDKTTGKTSKVYAIGTQADESSATGAVTGEEESASTNDALNYVLISDVAFTGRSFF